MLQVYNCQPRPAKSRRRTLPTPFLPFPVPHCRGAQSTDTGVRRPDPHSCRISSLWRIGAPPRGRAGRLRNSRPTRTRTSWPRQSRQLSALPPLVTSWEVERLRMQLAEAAEGKRFLLQGGACAERFDQCSAKIITNKLKILLQMSLVLTYGLKRKIIRVGRFAGQYAKPRSADLEERDGVALPSYRGELVNGSDFTPEARIPDPETDAARPRALGHDSQLHPFAGRRWVRRPPPPRVLGSRFRPPLTPRPGVPAGGRRHLRLAAVHGDPGRYPGLRDQPRRFLHQPRGSAPALRAGGDPAGAAARRVVQPRHPLPVDRDAHRRNQRCPRRVLSRHPQPHRHQGRADDDGRVAARTARPCWTPKWSRGESR